MSKKRPYVLFFGSYDESVHPRTRVLREGLLAAGCEVRERKAELGFSTAQRVQMLSDPRRLPGLALRILRCWAVLVWQWLAGPRRFDAVVVGYLGHFDVLLARVLHPRTTIVLDYLISLEDTAADRRSTGGVVGRVMRALDLMACACADVVLVDTHESRQTVPERFRDKVLVVLVGAPQSWFSAPPELRPPGPLRVVFFGLFTPLQGAPVLLSGIRQAMDAGRALEVTIIGSGQDYEAARQQAPVTGVRWLDWVASDDLPALVAAHDLCVGILGATPKALRVVPNKAYQGAAAGTLVLTSDTEPQRTALPSTTVFVPPDDADGLTAALLCIPEGEELARRRHASFDEATRTVAPEAVVQPLLDLLTAMT
jgi:glycosyltransferase involved in cell wall biosynthesis